jgi:RNA polymerase sigma-70 factor (ECF subfamily)
VVRTAAELTELLLAEVPLLYRVAHAVALGHDAAEEIVAEALIALGERLTAPEAEAWDGARIRQAAYEAAARTALGLPAGEGARSHQPPGHLRAGGAALPPPPGPEALERVRAAIADLDAPYRLVILLRESEGISVPEIARMLRVSERAVEIRLQRAREGLVEALTR